MTRATVSADGETITVHIPLTFRKRGGRKRVVTPDGADCPAGTPDTVTPRAMSARSSGVGAVVSVGTTSSATTGPVTRVAVPPQVNVVASAIFLIAIVIALGNVLWQMRAARVQRQGAT